MARDAVAEVKRAFQGQWHTFGVKGAPRPWNTADPSVNDPAGGHIAAITGLDDFGFQPNNVAPTDGDGNAIAPLPFPANPTSNGFFFGSQCFRGPETNPFIKPPAVRPPHTATYSANPFVP